MSIWTHISGTIEVEVPFAACSLESTKGYLEWVIDDLKANGLQITGSERNAEFTVIPSSFITGGSAMGDVYGRATISIYGHLRDRSGETSIELNNWLDGFIHYADIRDICIKVKCDISDEPELYTDANCYSNDNLSTKEIAARYAEHIKNEGFYFANRVLTPDTCKKLAEFIKYCDPKTFLTMVSAMDIDRFYSIKLTRQHKSFLKQHGVEVPGPVETKDVFAFYRSLK